MRIAAIQKTTLLDYPGKLACTIFLPGCNLRCPFCHNGSLVLPERMEAGSVSEDALMEFLEKRKGVLDGVCITGGEPTGYDDLPALIRKIRQMGFLVKLDTNGTNPQMLQNLMEEQMLDYIAMDIKNCPDRYRETCGGIDVLSKVRRSVQLLMGGHAEYEFRTTVVKPFHDVQAMTQIGKWLHGAKRYFLQMFVDSGNLVGQGIAPLSEVQIRALHQAVLAEIPNTRIRGI